LSHTGPTADGSKYSDLKIAEAAPGIDVIVGGHTHTRLTSPIRVGSTLIVSAGERGEDLGALGLIRSADGRFRAAFYELRPVTADIPEDPATAAQAAGLREILTKAAETLLGSRTDMVAAETAFPLTPRFFGPENEGREIGLGDLVADSYRWAVRKAEGGRPDAPILVVHPWGHLRDTILPGLITVDDVYRVLSLGIGPDGRPGYPLVSIWLTGREIRRLFEVETTIAPGKEDAHLQIAGASVRFNPKRVPFDRVTRIEIEDVQGTMRPLEPKRLYRVVANLYMARMIEYVSRASYGILKLEPKDAAGSLRTDFENLIIDADPSVPGVQEIKEWSALVEFLRSLPDTDGNGTPDIPVSYASSAGRLAAEPSWNPVKLVAGAHGPTFILLGLIVGLPAILIIIVRAIRRSRARKIRRRRRPKES
jgi:5'-nucleotidase/UDP-sugar diphosphatase